MIFLVLIIGSTVQVAIVRFVNPPATIYMAWNWVKGADQPTFQQLPEMWRDLDGISPHLRRAVLAGEDQRFLYHHGFDFTEIGAALKDMASGGPSRGASTITMQVARTVFLWPDRTWLRKLAEGLYTVLIEVLWSKRRIFEVYLNTVDWGDQIMGIEAAARSYFGVSAHDLNRNQSALMAAILPNPHRWSPVTPGRTVRKRQQGILDDMDRMPLIS